MNNLLATTFSALITDENEQFYFLQKEGYVFRLAKSEGEHAIGDIVTGFAYLDKQDKGRLTTIEQTVTKETFGWGEVTDVRRDLGAFVNTGLPDKDIVVSLDDFPENDKESWPKKGDKLYVKLVVDKKDRIWGHLAWHEDFWKLSTPAFDNMNNQDLRAIVYRNKETGTFVYLPDNNMLGFIHPSERFSTPRIGQELQVRVIGFRKEDRSLNLSAKPRAYEMLDADSQMILAYLQTMGGKMPFNDKSAPEDIKATFGISKGQFKKSLGGLMKQGKIKQSPAGTELV
ncbi:S1 RNA-binding domain-containing protein [Lactococcus nasutitermitis]|uniref:S1 RNA-binding domain-containing protein n=1 Tax=Lactococcus nasutitermitis TaxID=1652957 RepID=A0ABV9JEB3_9LACT|nr:S1 RNA-binding domain-containing protein [Lactococcus nasutitermitis]